MDKKAMYKLSYGLFVLTAAQDGKDNGCIVNTAIQAASTPNQISVCVNKANHTHDMILATGSFTVSVLSEEADFSLFRRFGFQSGKDTDKFADYSMTRRGANGILYVTEGTNAFISVQVQKTEDLGSHTMFIGEVTDMEVLSDAPSATYTYYMEHIKPKPAAAPVNDTPKFRCTICGYEYEGSELPQDFICPICKHTAADFEKVGSVAQASAGEVKTSIQLNEKDNKEETAMAKFVCMVCGYVHEGDAAPEACPVCKAPAAKFVKQDAEMVWASEHVVGVAQGSSDDIMADLRANFTGECTEVGMYLAMARVAHREGYPEIGMYYEKAAYEEAEHAAKFAELLGEVITDSTKKNLELRIEAENGATAGKTDLAKRAKAANLDAIHDTVHEMARDEARHGKAFKGLHDRYFGK